MLIKPHTNWNRRHYIAKMNTKQHSSDVETCEGCGRNPLTGTAFCGHCSMTEAVSEFDGLDPLAGIKILRKF